MGIFTSLRLAAEYHLRLLLLRRCEVTLVFQGLNPISYSGAMADNGPTLEDVAAGTYTVTVTDLMEKCLHRRLVITGEVPID